MWSIRRWSGDPDVGSRSISTCFLDRQVDSGSPTQQLWPGPQANDVQHCSDCVVFPEDTGLCVHARHLPRTLPKDYKHVLRILDKTVSGQNVNEPPLHQGMVLSRGQAASSRAQRKVFLSGLRNLADWATSTSQLATPLSPDRT
ncbi:hypothetical protein INR49_008884, partial [Caranx melampygus]